MKILSGIALCACVSVMAKVEIKRTVPAQEAINVGLITVHEAIESYNQPVKLLKQYAEDPSVDLILIDIDSPGGQPASTEIIADFITWAREIKPVIAFISNYGTSGAYWLAAACTYIIAPETAVIGSIGVVNELPKKNKNIAFTAGRHKRVRYLADGVIADEDSRLIQQRLDRLYNIFCDVIAQYRNVPAETIKGLEAQIYLGKQALELGLIDQVGTLQDLFNYNIGASKG